MKKRLPRVKSLGSEVKLSGLPSVEEEPEEAPEELSGLPVRDDDFREQTGTEKSQVCETCGSTPRIVSNHLGVQAHCGPCRTSWGVSSTARNPVVTPTPPRGLHRTVEVEPDWNKAFEPIGDSTYEQVGPKRKRE